MYSVYTYVSNLTSYYIYIYIYIYIYVALLLCAGGIIWLATSIPMHGRIKESHWVITKN